MKDASPGATSKVMVWFPLSIHREWGGGADPFAPMDQGK